ncbi:50S ribosomal protein L35 [Mesoplasma sp. JKS002658]|uniref:50S ribosomal protein L35 n=1 Tax=Mesoplasma whartonense TaxID=2878854 RepID=UPI002022AC02|nr:MULTISPECIES: 50S ribosomal protein L35 [unclassified Mesoplasma]MCL8211331.1 50S ribosomal protein L35 [Mesoplasma sp. JKS002664]MCL8212184.1 50S ribosomal protein L35 [Mesoplasma sp. JKS002662]MCL8212552.1 50S ribosomal protein L35 [Mesoplasma sp. JKS002661]MCL8213326.1 50S ribosomal protein L35 [Mesoplasma sp. JKS002660]MCL8214287.1 50S ribosomal protein L35 [Mesoplasma sp. JKS002658]
MPKMKTKKALAKRVNKNASGKLKRAHAYRSHRATGKTTKQKRHLKKATYIKKVDAKRLESLLQD